jgi:conjugal transfer pilus assembly protein TraV
MRNILLYSAVLLNSGCSSFGSPEYSCSGIPEGKRCTPTRALYDGSNGGESPKAHHVTADQKNERDPGNSTEISHDQGSQVVSNPVTDPVIDTFVTPNLPDRPVPIRTPAQVMRIWVASWEDTSTGALISPGYIYTEVEPRRWVIGKPESAEMQQGRLFKPLEQSSSNPSPDKREKE